MTEQEAKDYKPNNLVITACGDCAKDGKVHELEHLRGFWRCPSCNKRAFEKHLPPEVA